MEAGAWWTTGLEELYLEAMVCFVLLELGFEMCVVLCGRWRLVSKGDVLVEES